MCVCIYIYVCVCVCVCVCVYIYYVYQQFGLTSKSACVRTHARVSVVRVSVSP
jgi:hypothetical protein